MRAGALKVLVDAGADTTLQDYHQRTALDYAAAKEHRLCVLALTDGLMAVAVR